MNRVSSIYALKTSGYPNPPYNYTLFDLNSLPDPPPRYRMFGETANEISTSRRLRRDDLETLIQFHFYGVDPNISGRATNMRLIRALFKLHYYMDDIHRPQTWSDMCDPHRDAGPRLLSCSVNDPNLVPVSRQYPRPPDPNEPAKPGFIRPFYVASNIPDSFVERMLTVGPPGAGRFAMPAATATVGRTPTPTPTPTPAPMPGLMPPPPAPSRMPPPAITSGYLVPPPATPRPSTSPSPDPMTGVVTDDNNLTPTGLNPPIELTGDGTPMPDFTPAGPPPFMHTPQTGSFLRLPNFKFHDVVEAIERAVMRFAYTDLERHPSATPRAPRPCLLAGSQEDLLKSIVSSTPTAAKVGIADGGSVDAMVLDKNGYGFPYRGRGPVWRANSCAVDAAIVVGRLLDAGSTNYDRRQPGWETRLSKAERAFIDVIDANWDVLSNEDSANLRDQFWRILAAENPAIRVGALNPMWTVWAAVATNIPQFHFSYEEALAHCPCRGAAPTNATFQASFVTPPVYPEDANGVTIQEMISRPFTPVQLSDCRECSNLRNSVTRERRLHNLPLRMAVTLDERVVIKNHTQDFTFDYCDINGQAQKATYRWLGGVYYHENHFRVLWSDNKRGEAGAGEVLQYDGRQNSGLVIGGITPHHLDSRIPPIFWKGKPIPLLIYERVMNPEPDVLNTAMQSMFNMVDSQMKNQPILQTHMAWKSTNGIPDTDASRRPWDPIFPNYANPFHLAPTAYNPPQQESSSWDFGTTDPPGSATNPVPISPRMHVPQAFTTDPMATLNSGAPISLPISVPITQHLNQANRIHLPSANPPATPPQATVGLSPQGPCVFVPSPTQQQQQQQERSPTPPLAGLPWEEWVTSPCCGAKMPKVVKMAPRKRVMDEISDSSSESARSSECESSESSENQGGSEDEYRPRKKKKKAVSVKGKQRAVTNSKTKGKQPSRISRGKKISK